MFPRQSFPKIYFNTAFIKKYNAFKQNKKVHCPPKVEVKPALLFPSFVYNSSINELKNMKLNEDICYEMII